MKIKNKHPKIETKDGGNPAAKGDETTANKDASTEAEKKAPAQAASSVDSIKDAVEAIQKTCAELRSRNDEKEAEVKKKGSADPLMTEQLQKINDSVDALQQKMSDQVARETKANRTATSQDPIVSGTDVEVKAHRDAFIGYLRKGTDAGLHGLEKKALSVNSDPDGGYLVTPEVSSAIIKTVKEHSPIRSVANVQTIGSDSIEFLVDKDDADAGWVAEEGARTDTDTPQVAKRSIYVHELYAQPKATQKLLDDASINIEQWLAEKVSEVFTRIENAAFVSGDGNGKPRGFTTYAAGTGWGQIEQVNSGSNGAVTADAFIKLLYALKEEYATRSTFLMNRAIVQAARLLKDSNNQYIWVPGLTAGASDTIVGRPVLQATDMATAATNSLSVALGDFSRGYQIVDRIGIRTLRDPFTAKPFVKFYTTKRVGGDVVNFEAIKLMKLAS